MALAPAGTPRKATDALCEPYEGEPAFKRYETKQQATELDVHSLCLHVDPTAGTIFTSPPPASACGSTPCT